MRKFDLLNFAREAAAGAPDMVRRRLLTAAASLALPGALTSPITEILKFRNSTVTTASFRNPLSSSMSAGSGYLSNHDMAHASGDSP